MQKYGWGLPIDISANGWQIDQLIIIIHVFMAILFVGWFCFFAYTLIRFRQRSGHKASHHVGHFKLPAYLEVGVALFEVVLLLGFSFPIWSQQKVVKPDEKDAVRVRVVAQQFAWNVHYPGVDGKFGKTDPALMSSSNPLGLDKTDPSALDDISITNQLHVPTGRNVIVYLSSKDVIHSFTIPVMRVKQDAIPGHAGELWFQAKDAGDFEIACAQLCGLGHYRMRGFFISESPEKFEAWLKAQAPKPPAVPKVAAQAAPAAPATPAPVPSGAAHV
jgi:cytochrome c oxidase subunit 2